MHRLPPPGAPEWALTTPPPDLANAILLTIADVEAYDPAPLGHAALLTIGLAAAASALTVVTGLWAPVLATAQLAAGWLSTAAALIPPAAVWPAVAGGAALVALEMALLARQ